MLPISKIGKHSLVISLDNRKKLSRLAEAREAGVAGFGGPANTVDLRISNRRWTQMSTDKTKKNLLIRVHPRPSAVYFSSLRA
jgi:hypothetical protein